MRRDTAVRRLLDRDGAPSVELSDGSVVPADVVVCGTGSRQPVPSLPESIQRALEDERGNIMLYRDNKPLTVPDLLLWLQLVVLLPAERRLAWMEPRTEGRHARGTNILPFSMHDVDEMLGDLDADVSRPTRIRQWLLPVDPGAHAGVARRVLDRIARHQTTDTPSRTSAQMA